MSTEKGQKMTLKKSTEGNKIPINFIMRVVVNCTVARLLEIDSSQNLDDIHTCSH